MYLNKDICAFLKVDNAAKLSPQEMYALCLVAIHHLDPDIREDVNALETAGPAFDARWETIGNIPSVGNSMVTCRVLTGANEGCWLVVYLDSLDRRNEKTPFFTFKSLNEGPDAYATLGRIGGLLVYLLDAFFLINNVDGEDDALGSEQKETLIRKVGEHAYLHRDPVNGLAWVEDGSTGLGVSVHPNIDESGSPEGMISRGYWDENDRLVWSHGFIYNTDRFVCNAANPYENIVAEESNCNACQTRRAREDIQSLSGCRCLSWRLSR